MQLVEIYTSPFCGYCHAAKRLLDSKGAQFTEYNVFLNPGKRQEMMRRSNGGHTVPQIFVGAAHVGGFAELADLDRSGKLEALLAA